MELFTDWLLNHFPEDFQPQSLQHGAQGEPSTSQNSRVGEPPCPWLCRTRGTPSTLSTAAGNRGTAGMCAGQSSLLPTEYQKWYKRAWEAARAYRVLETTCPA